MTRLKLCAAAMLGLVLEAAVAAWAAGPEPYDGPQWPNVPLDGAQSPNVPLDGARWPNVRLDDIEAQRVNPRPAFVDPEHVESRILGRRSGVSSRPNAAERSRPAPNPDRVANGFDAHASGTARWPNLPAQKPPSPFVFEAGMRYWYSSGSMSFGFANNMPLFGNPTSTLDWDGLSAHSGEVFGRIDHIPSGMFVKGMLGLGTIVDGSIDDRDFLIRQLKFSDTTSKVNDGNLKFAMIDAGWSYSPVPGMRLGFFAGYHFWQEKVTAYGVVCNQASVLGCTFPGEMLLGFDTAVLRYQPTWHAARVGIVSQFAITDRLSFSAEVAGIPFVSLQNKDSHLLRQSPADLGPAPNIITDNRYGYGVESDLFVNYALTPNIEIGAGMRYWGLTSRRGSVRFGPSFAATSPLNNFDQERYGLLLQAKGRF